MSDPEQIRAFKVHGRVQGVGFRWWAQHRARHLGLRGLVRNCRDGTVEIAFAGPAAATDEMRQLLEAGPPHGSVVDLEEITPPEHLPQDFVIDF